MAWMGLKPMGSTRCEMSIQLAKMGVLTPVNSAMDLCHELNRMHADHRLHTATQSHEQLLKQYGPKTVYRPLLSWLENPKIVDKSENQVNALSLENRRLRQKLAEVYNSPTWRASAKLKKMTTKWGQLK